MDMFIPGKADSKSRKLTQATQREFYGSKLKQQPSTLEAVGNLRCFNNDTLYVAMVCNGKQRPVLLTVSPLLKTVETIKTCDKVP
jgi:hypothetical protein